MAQQATAELIWTETDSSNIKSVAYHDNSSTLCVKFIHGGLYTYKGVDNDIYVGLVHAPSVGKYLNEIVKPNYAFERYFSEAELLESL